MMREWAAATGEVQGAACGGCDGWRRRRRRALLWITLLSGVPRQAQTLAPPHDCFALIRNQVAFHSYERWRERHPSASKEEVEAHEQGLRQYTKCEFEPGHALQLLSPAGASARHAASPAASPSTSTSAAAAATPASAEAQHQRGRGPKVLDLTRCLSTIDNAGAAAPQTEACHSAHDPNAPLKYAEWDAEMVVERAAADGVTVLATAPVGTTPRAVFHSTVMGPSSMQTATASHVAGLRFRFGFVPVEPGPHQLAVRLEYFDANTTLEGVERPQEYLGLEFNGSPWRVQVPEDAALSSRAYNQLPVCDANADRGGSWRLVPALYDEPAPFQSPHNSNGCPHCTSIDRRSVPHTCEATAEPAVRLVDGTPVPWDTWSTWVGHDCRYCRFDRPAALQCLKDKRLLIVGDSVSMQFCSHFQCAYNGTDCVRGCEHRQNLKGASDEKRAAAAQARRTMPCFETQPGAGPVYCVSIDNFLGTAFNGLDRGMMLLRDESDDAALANVAAALDRAYAKVPGRLQDVLVMGAGLHDNAFGSVDYSEDDPKSPFLRTFRILARTRFSRIVWVMPTAVHRHVSVTMDCSERGQLLAPSCMQFVQRGMTNTRTLKIVRLVRAAMRQAWAEFPQAPPLSVIDGYALTEAREQHTVRHTDLVHYCDEVNRELGQLVMHSLCSRRNACPAPP